MEKRKSEWFEWIKALLIAFALIFIVRTFFFAPIVVDGPSMMPTLHDGDQMIVNKIIYDVAEPERFDIVVFHASDKKDFIKRVVGLPGEHVAVKNDQLFIDGRKVKEPFIGQMKKGENTYTDDFKLEELPGGYEEIPEGYVLVLGDNRGNSTDSRILGLISMDQIVGTANLIYWPFDRMQIMDY
ncbi:signal peptidase I [Virgibacillus ihumii]|uniref:signal peptidase I n=1 Tax=Virgibacillus ihumii TaxID=2686091 RepID=UPI00157D2770|nr:signal peptidase I [Virgibacillus ihumii]